MIWLLLACHPDPELFVGDDDVVDPVSADDQDADGHSAGADCDDRDPTRNPGVEELCNGVDDDCDREVDEDACVEGDCADGADGDRDGLVDCEDADCAASAGCAEVCGNGDDDDGDGLTDCDDDECWGMDCHPAGVQVSVNAGTLLMYASRSRSSFDGCGSGVVASGHFESFAAADVSGTVRVLAPSESAWHPDAATTSCTWRLGTASSSAWEQHVSYGGSPNDGSSRANPLTRRDVTVEPGCRLDGSDFLPPRLAVTPADGLVSAEGLPWYVPAVDDPASLHASWHSSGVYPCSYWGSGSWTSEDELYMNTDREGLDFVGDIAPAGSYLALP